MRVVEDTHERPGGQGGNHGDTEQANQKGGEDQATWRAPARQSETVQTCAMSGVHSWPHRRWILRSRSGRESVTIWQPAKPVEAR